MKKQFYLLITLLVLLLMACSPVTVNQLPSEEVKENSSSASTTITSGTSLDVKFKPVAYASSYAYKINEEAIVEDKAPLYNNGYYIFSINNIDQTEGNVTVYAKNDAAADWIRIAEANYTLSLSALGPDAYVSKRTANSVLISINADVDASLVEYKASIEGRDFDFTKNYDSVTGTHTLELDGLEANHSYYAYIQQKFKDSEDDFGPATTLLIETYDANIESSLTLEVNETESAFTIGGIANGLSSLNLYKRKDNSSSSVGELIYENAIVDSNQTITINFDKLKSLESGYFYASGKNQDGKTVVSNILKYTTPLTLSGVATVNYKSVVLPINFADDIDSESLTFSISGAPNATAKAEDGKITISGLDSNTDYGSTLSIKPTNAEYATVESMTINNVKTKSFAGDDPVNGKSYEWVGKVKGSSSNSPTMSFVIKVTESADNSEYPYYVYYSEDDPISKSYNTDLRIMPLIDKAAGDEILNIQAPYPYGGTTPQQYAYKANSEKWNSFTLISPKSWKLNDNPEITKDRVKTTTITNAPIVGETTTDTTFEFMEYYDGETYRPVIKFKNMGTGSSASTVNGFLYTNSYNNNNGQEGEKYNDPLAKQDSIYCFYLTERESN